MERYGDYTEYEDDIPKRKSRFFLVMKILIAFVCIFVVGVLAFRMILFSYYPDSMKNIRFTENLVAYYNENSGNMSAKTQDLRAPYDDERAGHFFCDNLIIVEEANELQVSVRFNTSVIETLEAKTGLTGLSADDKELLSFRLYDNRGNYYENPSYIGNDSFMMYRYYKVAFSNVDFENNDPEWIRIEIFIKGQTDSKPFAMVPVYENNADYAVFSDFDYKWEENAE